MSEKFDGQRAFWDGGVSRGMPASDVPWANVEKDHIRRTQSIATGLWSRYGKAIFAPDYFLDSLPPFMLDGELYLGPGSFQDLMSTVGTHVPGLGWRHVRFMVLDSPRPRWVFEDGVINHTNFKKKFSGILQWLDTEGFENSVPEGAYYDFHSMLGWLGRNLSQNNHCVLAPQERLPMGTAQAEARLDERLQEILSSGGEGLIVRRANGYWQPERSHEVLKYKPENDADGVVTGYIWGRETDKGSKLLGLMGALVLDFNGKRLELSGFTNAERVMCYYEGADHGFDHARINGEAHPGEEADRAFHNPKFPLGSVVSFKYRELTRDGIPKEARFWRKRAQTTGVVA